MDDDAKRRAAEAELHAELSPRHLLFGVSVRAVGYRQDCDDVLFELLDGSKRYAVVHLSFAQHPEPDPRWPETSMFENWDDFCWKDMTVEHNNWIT